MLTAKKMWHFVKQLKIIKINEKIDFFQKL